MKNIAIIGMGIVGTAVYEGMKNHFEVLTYDKYKPESKDEYQENECLQQISEVEGPIFICLPTPMNADGSANCAIIENIIVKLNNLSKNNLIVIKSTVPPGTTKRFIETYKNLSFVFNPEFLTEANAIQDFQNQDRIIVGVENPSDGVVMFRVYNESFPKVPLYVTNATTAEMIKYIANCFLATKVSFANEMYQICEKLGINYDKAIELAKLDQRLGQSHWKVPGPMPASDGSGRFLMGFSGSCFVKDINALIAKAHELGVNPMVMQAAWEKNKLIRPEKDWENLKGRAII